MPEWSASTTHSPSTRRRWSSGATWWEGSSGKGVGRLAAGKAYLEGAELLEVAGHRGLGRLDALGGQELDQMGLAGHDPGLEEPGDPVLALVLGHPVTRPLPRRPTHASRPRMACIRLAA